MHCNERTRVRGSQRVAWRAGRSSVNVHRGHYGIVLIARTVVRGGSGESIKNGPWMVGIVDNVARVIREAVIHGGLAWSVVGFVVVGEV